MINNSQHRNGCDLKHEIVKYRGKYFLPAKRYFFIEFNNYLTGKDFKKNNIWNLLEMKKDDVLL